MPSSYPHNISKLLATIIPINPRSVYEVGIGYGKWGALLREYLDEWERRVWIEGCEIFEPYLQKTPAQGVYDHVDVGDWLDVKPTRTHYELVLMIDVLEHFTATDAVVALTQAQRLGPVLISTPIDYPQGVVNGNEHERHLSEWTSSTLAQAGFIFQDMGSDERSAIGLVFA